MARLDEYLTDSEFEVFEQVDEGKDWPVPKNLCERLLELGYVRESPKGLEITSAGQMRLALGR